MSKVGIGVLDDSARMVRGFPIREVTQACGIECLGRPLGRPTMHDNGKGRDHSSEVSCNRDYRMEDSRCATGVSSDLMEIPLEFGVAPSGSFHVAGRR